MLLPFAADLPPSDAIRQKAGEIVSRKYYDLSTDSSASGGEPLLLKFLRWIAKPFQWLFDHMEGLPDFLRWLVVILFALLCVALIGHIIYTFIRAIRLPLAKRGRYEGPASKEIDPAELERQADRAGAAGDYIGGVRLLFRAALRRIELAERKKLRPGITNRELLRRYRSSPLGNPLARFVDVIELKWYGKLPCEQADYAACQSEHVRICQYANERQPALAT
ncbi:MAG: hypothetical protein WD669_04600 [Pirellulales bacterium]